MATRTELLRHLWRHINSNLDESSLQKEIARSRQKPNDPFGDTGAALERLLAVGANLGDICLIRRQAAYEATFGTLYAIGDPGVDDNNVFMLFEELLGADPTGREGRPDSANVA